jgi:hypothetical protein
MEGWPPPSILPTPVPPAVGQVLTKAGKGEGSQDLPTMTSTLAPVMGLPEPGTYADPQRNGLPAFGIHSASEKVPHCPLTP